MYHSSLGDPYYTNDIVKVEIEVKLCLFPVTVIKCQLKAPCKRKVFLLILYLPVHHQGTGKKAGTYS